MSTSIDLNDSFQSGGKYDSQDSTELTSSSASSVKESEFDILKRDIHNNVTKVLIEHDPLLYIGIPSPTFI